MRSSGKPKCLLVNDCQMQLMALKNIYSFLGYEITTALNGFKAIQEVKALSYEEITHPQFYLFCHHDGLKHARVQRF